METELAQLRAENTALRFQLRELRANVAEVAAADINAAGRTGSQVADSAAAAHTIAASATNVAAATETSVGAGTMPTAASQNSKPSFISTISHELRTPLNAVLGLTQLLLDSPLNAEQRQHATMVSESGQLLLRLINDILDLAKAESGRLMLEPAWCSLMDVMESSVLLCFNSAAIRDIDLYLIIDPTLPARVYLDPVRMQQVLNNLLSNAIKFTDRGDVEVTVRFNESANELLTIQIRDTGIGIARQHIQTLFESFQQIPGVTTRHGGTGLGLSICKQLVTAMGANITCDSTLGVGTTFIIDRLAYTPPLEPTLTRDLGITVRQHLEMELQPNLIHGSRVLILSPRAGSSRMWSVALEAIGSVVVTATHLQEAFAQLEAPDHTPFTVMLMDGYDSLMESMSPAGTSEDLAQNQTENTAQSNADEDAHIPSGGVRMIHSILERRIAACCTLVLVFVSESSRLHGRQGDSDITSTMIELAKQCLDVQVASVPTRHDCAVEIELPTAPRPLLAAELIKPFKMTTLLQVVNQQLQRSRASNSLTATTTAATGSASPHVPAPTRVAHEHRIRRIAARAPLNIMVVEDNVVNQRLMAAILKRLGYDDVITVASGEECLELLQATEVPVVSLATVILMDLTMPGMDGFECTRQIRSNSALSPSATMPWIIAQTAAMSRSTHEDCIQAGMNDALAKSLDIKKIAQALIQAYERTH